MRGAAAVPTVAHMSPAAHRRALALLALVAVLAVAAGAFALGRASREDPPDGTAPPARTTEQKSDVPEISGLDDAASLPALEESTESDDSADTGGDTTGESTGTATSPDTDTGTDTTPEPEAPSDNTTGDPGEDSATTG